jgi:hypothetical protein
MNNLNKEWLLNSKLMTLNKTKIVYNQELKFKSSQIITKDSNKK